MTDNLNLDDDRITLLLEHTCPAHSSGCFEYSSWIPVLVWITHLE